MKGEEGGRGIEGGRKRGREEGRERWRKGGMMDGRKERK